MKGQNEFDEFANDYRRIHTQNVKGISGVDSDYFTEYKIAELYARKEIKERPYILDFGCGDGNSARHFFSHYAGTRYVGIDISASSIDEAKKTYSQAEKNGSIPKGDYSFIRYNGRHIPFGDNTFDVVYMACVMHHIIPYYRIVILKECMRVLKPDGKLIIFEHNPMNPLTLHMVNTCAFDVNAKLLTMSELCHITQRAGGIVESKRYTIFMPRKGFFNKITDFESKLTWCPFGGQYYIVARKRRR